MDSTGLTYEPVAESLEIGNDPSGVTRDGGFPEQQLSEHWLFKFSVVGTNFKKLDTHPSLFAGSYFEVSPQEYQHNTRTLRCIGTSKLFDNSNRSSSHTACCSKWCGWRGEGGRGAAAPITKLLQRKEKR